ncbi:hypothetical protein K1719_039021 [Acacia pycnantha]|nr:hypothetical protein K1719_039021 [Acacia pycnantha]
MEKLQISSPLVVKEAEVRQILIGKVMSNMTYTCSTMEAILQKAWNLQYGFDVIEVTGSTFMFKFSNEDERIRILRGQPWSINGNLLNLLERSKYKSCEEYDFSHFPVWIQLHNVPMEALCLDNAIKIEGYVEEVVVAEDPQYNGSRVWIFVRYEKLQNFCYNCGKIGHDNQNCKVQRLMFVVDSEEHRFGPWITTNVSQNWKEVLVVVHDDWDKAGYFRRKKAKAILRRKDEDKRKNEETDKAEENDLFCIKLNKFPGVGIPWEHNQKNNGKESKGESGSVLSPDDILKIRCTTLSEDPNCTLKKSLDVQEENPLAMVLYCGKDLSKVISGINGLILKRRAEEDLKPMEFKKRKTNMGIPNSPRRDISCYVANLQKVKEKMRRSTRKRIWQWKENVLVEEWDPDEVIKDLELPDIREDLELPDIRDAAFVFKSKGDHRALVVDCCFCEDKAPKSFKFEANWSQHDDFLHIVEKGWNDIIGCVDDKVMDLSRRLDACKRWLREWSRREFPNFSKEIDQLGRKLSICHTGRLSDGKLEEIERLVGQLEEVWTREETYWWQRSRIAWLNCGDKNTKFFRNSVLQRR